MPFQTFACYRNRAGVPHQDHQPLGANGISDGGRTTRRVQTESRDELQHHGSSPHRDGTAGNVRRAWSLGVQQFSIFESAHLVAPYSSSHDDSADFKELSIPIEGRDSPNANSERNPRRRSQPLSSHQNQRDRTSGRTTSIPAWFVLDGQKLYLLPVHGSDTQWYQNLLQNPSIRTEARSVAAEFRATPIIERKSVASLVERFRETYGANDVKKYYPKFDMAVVVKVG